VTQLVTAAREQKEARGGVTATTPRPQPGSGPSKYSAGLPRSAALCDRSYSCPKPRIHARTHAETTERANGGSRGACSIAQYQHAKELSVE
jgi:hypothetical protein